MRYATARFNQHQRDLAYRIYVTDVLRITARYTAALGQSDLDFDRFADRLYPQPVDNRTADDIIEGIRNKLK
jgi:hypothetical protein